MADVEKVAVRFLSPSPRQVLTPLPCLRYSEFLPLHQAFREENRGFVDKVQFPSKTLFGSPTGAAVLRPTQRPNSTHTYQTPFLQLVQRQLGLQQFLRKLAQVTKVDIPFPPPIIGSTTCVLTVPGSAPGT